MLDGPNKSPGGIDEVSWWFAPIIAICPALLVAALAGFVAIWTESIRAIALVWGISAWVSVVALSVWNRVTHRFSVLDLSTALTIAAIVGAPTGLIAAMTGASPADVGIRFVCSFAGALQGAIVAWFIVRPDIRAQQTSAESNAEEEEEEPNPPTSPS